MKEEFNKYMEGYKTLSLKEKQDLIIKQLKALSSLTHQMCEADEIPNELLLNKQLFDIEKEGYTEDDFAEAVIVLVNSIQNSVCDYYLSQK